MTSRLHALPALLSVAIATSACGGGGVANARDPRVAPRRADSAVAPRSSSSEDPLPTLDALAARGPSVAPLMREVQRLPDARAKTDLTAERDTCWRAVLAATRPVKAFFADAKGTPRGDAFDGEAGVVPPGGPACVKRGDVVRLTVEGDAPSVRAVVFASP